MILFSDANGTIQANFGTPVYQGSANSNIIYLIAPYAPASTVTVAFQLPDGTAVGPVDMTRQNAIPGVQNASGTSFAGWSYVLPATVTAKYGTVTAQFFFYAPTGESTNPTSIIATSATSFQVGRGAAAVLPDTPDADVYESILSNLAQLQTDLNGGYYGARAIFPWSNGATYGQNEITFYPSIGTYGAFVQSVVARNTNHAPYIHGALNSAYWSEVVNFNNIAEDYFDQVQAAVTQAENAAIAAKAQAESAAQSASNAENSAGDADSSANLAKTYAQNAENSATESQGFAQQAENSAITAKYQATAAENSANAAQTFAENSANSATEAQGYAEYTKQLVDGLGGVYIPQGSLAFASLPAQPAAQYQGYVWNITDAFTTDSRFLEGAGESVPAGANVACVLVDGAYKYDVLSGIVDLSNYAQINGTYSGMTVGKATQADNAATATDSEKLGGVLSSEYTLKTGTYPDMAVGNATNATNADTADSATSAQDAAKLGGVAADQYALISQLPTGIIPVSELPTATEEEYNKHALYLYNDSLSYIVSKTIVVPPGTPSVETLDTTLSASVYGVAIATQDKCYLFNNASYNNYILQFDITSQTVTTLNITLPDEIKGYTASLVGTTCYIFGGYIRGIGHTNQIIKFDTVLQKITKLNSVLPITAEYMASAAVDTNCYIFGGDTNGASSAYLNTIVQFDALSETVTLLSATLPEHRAYMAVASVGTDCYIIGGSAKSGESASKIVQFDTISQTVTTLSTTIGSVSSPSIAVINTNCYIFGGRSVSGDSNRIRNFDTILKTISISSINLPEEMSKSASVAVGDSCYIFYGTNSYKFTPNGGYSYNEYSYKTLLNQGDITYETV